MAKKNSKHAKDKEKESAATPALVELDEHHISTTLYTYEHDGDHMSEGFGLEGAAQLAGQNADGHSLVPEQMFKTLLIDVGERVGHDLATVIVPVTCHVNLKAAAAALGVKKAQMADPAVAQRQTGYVVGGISPFGHKQKHPTVLDESALEFEEILVSGGKRGLSVGVNPLDIIDVLDARIASVGAAGSHPR
ncbi:aminoacyl-tRNA deacylase [Alloscardovia macacae]|uniref:Cys-tRNA(Pro)/Cys-tRNA(Cys) deacylase n=1 Tax=Alloscardovia macacae TaxID=1160091 RepID=A0A261F1R0_9BIFI|nr:aminoacyl-tRNA deacylase [Alloscardovia macacae]OZG53060.1 aminoacyl-tRNA deacylase [Alloscardovia macacae]